KVVFDLTKKDQNGNVILREEGSGEFVEHQSRDNLVSVNGRLVALVDVEDMIVIDTNEILLVMPKSKSQDVKKIVEKLKQEKKKNFL
ncbi:MAG TPA: mannose-1-phosphate guanylyltransferase/mannose-6-phosphate isomerase, partial [Patescibacteria group bacterium]|nr:mannose-1-phosphate guanylyltransferase/mannose-6-phosphate isomerase [Patescibacteria group bacterium]